MVDSSHFVLTFEKPQSPGLSLNCFFISKFCSNTHGSQVLRQNQACSRDGWVGGSRSEYFCPKLLSSKISVIFGNRGFDTRGIWLWWIYKANGKDHNIKSVDFSSQIPNRFEKHRHSKHSQLLLIARKLNVASTWILHSIYVSRWNLKWNIAQFHWNVFRLIILLKSSALWNNCVEFWRSLLRKSTHMRFNGCAILLLS